MKWFWWLALLAGSAAAQDTGARQGTIQNSGLAEISGLARSLADPKILWGHNDSGNAAVLFRIGLMGEDLGTVKLPGGSLFDWEDIAAFRWRGQPALLLADVGDNFGLRDHLTLYAVSDPGRGQRADLLWVLEFRFPDGARDCEAVAVDAAGGDILLLSKRDRPPRLYRLPLPLQPRSIADGTAVVPQTAQFLGTVGVPAAPVKGARGRFVHMPTAMDISADGRRAVIVTPRTAYLYRRERNQPWIEVLNRAPQAIVLPRLPGIEAGAFSADGRHLYVASEELPIGFARIPLRP